MKTKNRPITLTAKQRRAADALRECRPAVIPGTNVVPSAGPRKHWYDLVCSVMEWNHVTRSPMLVKEFCDRAGVPD